jgi:hypothetical protein
VIDPASGVVTGRLDTAGVPSSVTDEVVLIRTGGDVTTGLAAVSLASGRALWHERADEIYHAYLTGAGQTVTALSRGDGVVLEEIARDGDVRRYDGLRGHAVLWTDLSTDEVAVIGHDGPFPGGPGPDGLVHADAFDLADWSLARDALQIDVDGNP